jgi:hypothetical protein
MANLNFDEGQDNIKRSKATAHTGFARKLISWGLAKTEAQANIYLVVFIFIGIAITVFNITRM